jgi:anti-sigma factor RsiW
MTDKRPVSEDDLHAYVDAVPDSARRTEIEEYLETHPEIAYRVQRYVRQRADLRAALRPIVEEPIPPELNLKRMIDARHRATASWWRAAAAILLICIGAGGGWSLRGAVGVPPAAVPSGIEALAQEAADSYAVYAPDRTRPVEIRAADRAELVDWAAERLHHPLAVPDLSASGYRFMGGRIVPTAHGPAVLFMYDNDHGTRLVMLSRRMEVDQQTAQMTPHAQGDVDGFTWADDGIGYSLVGPLPSPTLHPIADVIRRQEKGI